MAAHTLYELFVEELADLLSAEHQLTKALPKIAEAASDKELKKAFEDHLEQTKVHVERLESVFENLDEKPKMKTCKGMEGLLKEGDEFVKAKKMDPSIRDAGLISAAERVEHYEIAGYGSAMAAAEELGYTESVNILKSTFEEEEKAASLLSSIAEKSVNPAAGSVHAKTKREPVGASR